MVQKRWDVGVISVHEVVLRLLKSLMSCNILFAVSTVFKTRGYYWDEAGALEHHGV